MTFFQKLRQTGALPYLFLLGVALVMMLILIVRGLNLGFWGDILNYEYHYQTLGIRGGMNWLVTGHWGRHLLGAIYSAPLHILFPANATVWYIASFVTHFGSGIAFFVFMDALLRRRLRWLTVTAALIFFFSLLEASTNFEFPTIAPRDAATILTFISLWAYIQCLRSNRRGWYGLSLLAFIVSVMSYEQNAAFFVIYPVIAYFEEPPHSFQTWRRWFWQALSDLSLYMSFVVIYFVILLEIFPGESNFASSLSFIFRQILNGLNILLNPFLMGSRAIPALQGTALLITLVLALAVFALIYVWTMREKTSNRDGLTVIVIGAILILANLASVAPTIFTVEDNPRLLYLAGGGASLLLLGVIHLVFRNRTAKALVVAALAAFLIAPGVTEIFQFQQEYAHQNQQRQTVLSAIASVVKLRPGAEKPYLVLVTNADPDTDLSLHAQDINFPYMMDMALHTDGLSADALYFNIPASFAPRPDQTARSYVGRFIIADVDGIYSAVRPGTPIDPKRLVLVSYDANTKSAQILDSLPVDMLSRANIVQRAPTQWRTNFDLLEP